MFSIHWLIIHQPDSWDDIPHLYVSSILPHLLCYVVLRHHSGFPHIWIQFEWFRAGASGKGSRGVVEGVFGGSAQQTDLIEITNYQYRSWPHGGYKPLPLAYHIGLPLVAIVPRVVW